MIVLLRSILLLFFRAYFEIKYFIKKENRILGCNADNGRPRATCNETCLWPIKQIASMFDNKFSSIIISLSSGSFKPQPLAMQHQNHIWKSGINTCFFLFGNYFLLSVLLETFLLELLLSRMFSTTRETNDRSIPKRNILMV